MAAFYLQWQQRQVLRELNFLATIDIDSSPRFWSTFIRAYVCWRTLSCEVDYVETSVEWQQWAVADSDFE